MRPALLAITLEIRKNPAAQTTALLKEVFGRK
jgi:hypothetical protein